MKTFTLAGHLGAAPTLKTKGDTQWTDLRIAVNGRNDRTDWFWVTTFGALAEAICNHLGKGSGITIQGELRCDEYNGKERTKLIAQQATFFGKRKAEGPTPQPTSVTDNNEDGEDEDDDIVF